MNIVLIGYRGTGKSTVGGRLGERLGWPVVSTDAEVVRRAGLPIPEIVRRFGWEHFRDLEAEVCREVGRGDRQVIDTGGGAVLRQDNLAALKQNGRLIWLTATVDTIVQRIGSDTGRPSLTGAKSFTEEVEDVLRQREPVYRAAADHEVSTEGRPLEEVVETILAALRALPYG